MDVYSTQKEHLTANTSSLNYSLNLVSQVQINQQQDWSWLELQLILKMSSFLSIRKHLRRNIMNGIQVTISNCHVESFS